MKRCRAFSGEKSNSIRLKPHVYERSPRPVLVLVLFLIPSCCDPGPSPSSLAVTDSAGIQILEYPSLPDSAHGGWWLSEEPSLTLGEEAGDEPFLFSRVRGVVRLQDGRIVVADGRSNELRIFSASGAHLFTAGGTGQGPGEFSVMGTLFRGPGDSLAVTNVFERTVLFFSPNGLWVRTVRLDPPEGTSTLFAEDAFEDGSLLVRAMVEAEGGIPEEGYYRPEETYLVYSSDGVPLFPLGTFPGPEHQALNENGRVMLRPLTMGRGVKSAVAKGAVWLGTTDRFEIVRYGVSEKPSTILRASLRKIPFGNEVRRRWIDHTLQRYEDPERVRRIRQQFDGYIWPDSLPVFSGLKGDTEGNLWVQRFRPEYLGGQDLWWVFDVGGHLLAAVETPGAFSVHAIGEDYVLGLTTDGLGVERVVEFRLEKSAGK